MSVLPDPDQLDPGLQRGVQQLFSSEFDLLVVGGGICGACVAWDAALRGLRVALIERDDFGSGASANSLKLLHGGLRYVRRALPREARDAVRERRGWLRNAPHLVAPVPVLVPTYPRSMQNRFTVPALLAINDLVSWDRNEDILEERRIPRARMLSKREVLELAHGLGDTPVSGGALFYDGQILNTERLVLEVVRAAARAGAVVANYVELDSGILESGRVRGARLVDRVARVEGRVKAGAIINATGGEAPFVARLLARRPANRMPQYSLALNVMLGQRQLHVALALAAKHSAGSNRQLLRVPWHDREILGTYHRLVTPDRKEPGVEERDVVALLARFNSILPATPARIEDVVLVHAGILPLDGPPTADVRLLRRHRIVDHAEDGASGAVSLISVKFTTARLAAEEAINAVLERSGRQAAPCSTATTHLPSAPRSLSDHRAAAVRLHPELPPEILEHLLRTYGNRYQRVLSLRDSPDWSHRVDPQSCVIHAEFVHAVRYEMAQTAEDLVWRRTELGSRGVFGAHVMERATAVILAELGSRRDHLAWRTGHERFPGSSKCLPHL